MIKKVLIAIAALVVLLIASLAGVLFYHGGGRNEN